MSSCLVSWEVDLDLIGCCTSGMMRVDITLWLASFLTVFELTLMGLVVANIKNKPPNKTPKQYCSSEQKSLLDNQVI